MYVLSVTVAKDPSGEDDYVFFCLVKTIYMSRCMHFFVQNDFSADFGETISFRFVP